MTAKEFKVLLDRTGVKQQELSVATGVYHKTVSYYAVGARPIPDAFVQAAVPFIYKLCRKRAQAAEAAIEKYAPLAAARQSTTRKAG